MKRREGIIGDLGASRRHRRASAAPPGTDGDLMTANPARSNCSMRRVAMILRHEFIRGRLAWRGWVHQPLGRHKRIAPAETSDREPRIALGRHSPRAKAEPDRESRSGRTMTATPLRRGASAPSANVGSASRRRLGEQFSAPFRRRARRQLTSTPGPWRQRQFLRSGLALT
jgi:hypothetical protein